MKKILIFILCSLFSNVTLGQLALKIKLIEVYNSSTILPEGTVYDEDLANGPTVNFMCLFINDTDSNFVIYPPDGEFTIKFSYRGEEYSSTMYDLGFVVNDSVNIESKSVKQLETHSYLLLGTPIHEKIYRNYTKELLEILPTIKLYYREKARNLRFVSSEIMKIRIIK